MYVLRQLASTSLTGAVTDMAATNEYLQQLTDANPRYILKLAGDGKFSSDSTQVANGASFVIPKPMNYTATKLLHVMISSDQTVKLVTTSTVNATSTILIRAGTNQVGVVCFLGQVSTMTLTNPQATTANIEWFLFEFPDITTTGGWRDGSQSLGTLS